MFQVVPSIDLRGGKVVRLQQGDYNRQLDYDLDPIQTARAFESAGAEWMHVVDLDGAKQGAVAQAELIGRIIAATRLKVQVGGGVRSTADIDRLLAAGAARVVVGTRAIEAWDWFANLVSQGEYAHKLTLALDAKNGQVATRGWTNTTGRLAVEIAAEVSDWPLAGILYTDVAKDGMLQGPNLEQTRKLAEATRVPVIASGGVGHLEHIHQLLQLPVWGVIVGRSLHEKSLDLAAALAAARSAASGRPS
jgi:phosphoribosylformimino-5-aminoimidazole carboxamide ribotide isomerase